MKHADAVCRLARRLSGVPSWLFLAVLLLPGIALADAETAALAKQVKFNVDVLWVLVSAALVFLMQAGFLCFEVGCVRTKNTVVTAMKNVGDWLVVSVIFYVFGFGIMFGHTAGGFIGTDGFAWHEIDKLEGASELGWAFVIFQLAFCGTAATIVSGAMSERTGFKAYLVFVVVMAAIIYPIWGHWVWGNLYISTNETLLQKPGRLQFVDFAGSSAVHNIGGWASLVGVWVVGPRLGRYATDGSLNPMDANSFVWSALGTMLLWFSWWGFNGGSTLSLSADVPVILFNTNLAAATGGLSAYMHCATMQRSQNITEKSLGGVLGGLVAITACCHVVTPVSALFIGVLAGIVHNYAWDLILLRWRLDDVVGAVPVHGFCGVLGILCVALFGQEELLPHPRMKQLAVQAGGAALCFFWSAGMSFIAFKILKATVGIRVSPMREIQGLSLEKESDVAEPDVDEGLDQMLAGVRAQFRKGERFDRF